MFGQTDSDVGRVANNVAGGRRVLFWVSDDDAQLRMLAPKPDSVQTGPARMDDDIFQS
jgi:hypothetical protein